MNTPPELAIMVTGPKLPDDMKHALEELAMAMITHFQWPDNAVYTFDLSFSASDRSGVPEATGAVIRSVSIELIN